MELSDVFQSLTFFPLPPVQNVTIELMISDILSTRDLHNKQQGFIMLERTNEARYFI